MRQSVSPPFKDRCLRFAESRPGLDSAEDSARGVNLPRGLQFGKLTERLAPIIAAYAWANIEIPALPMSESCAQMALNARRKRMPRQQIKALHEHEELVKSVKPSEQVRWTKDMRALLIEDDKDTAQFVCKGLKEHGYVVDCASEG